MRPLEFWQHLKLFSDQLHHLHGGVCYADIESELREVTLADHRDCSWYRPDVLVVVELGVEACGVRIRMRGGARRAPRSTWRGVSTHGAAAVGSRGTRVPAADKPATAAVHGAVLACGRRRPWPHTRANSQRTIVLHSVFEPIQSRPFLPANNASPLEFETGPEVQNCGTAFQNWREPMQPFKFQTAFQKGPSSGRVAHERCQCKPRLHTAHAQPK